MHADGKGELQHVNIVFLERLEHFVILNLANGDLNAKLVSKFMEVSKSTLNRRLSSCHHPPIIRYIRNIRMQKAATLLANGYKVSEVSALVGYKSCSYFAQSFKGEFKICPSLFRMNDKN